MKTEEIDAIAASAHSPILPPWARVSGRRLACLYVLFLLIAWGLGYPTLNRYDPRQVPGLADVKNYADIVTGAPVPGPQHLRYRVLVPWAARPFYHLAQNRSGSWNPVLFGLLAANSLFVAGTALLIIALGTRIVSYPAALVASLLYLVNFAVPNLRLVGLVDAGEAFFLLALYWVLFRGRFWLLPVITALGAMAKESFIPFSVVFTAAWWLAERKKLSSPRRTMFWIVASWAIGLASLLAVHYVVGGNFEGPITFAETLQGNYHYLSQFATSIWDRNLWYVFAWLLPLGIPKLKRFPRSWLMPTAAASLMAFVLDGYYSGAFGTVGRALFSVAGPLLALSTATLLVDLPVKSAVEIDDQEKR